MTELDLKYLRCPEPVLKTKKFLAKLASGALVKIITTDIDSIMDLQEFCKKTGHKMSSQTNAMGIITTVIMRR